MYTECPECKTPFRVTAKALQQAGGRVRCGGCGHAFSALEYLTEDLPKVRDRSDTPADNTDDAMQTGDELTESNRLLLRKLDEMAGSDDVQIEDTGSEWQVLNAIDADVDVAEFDAADSRSDDVAVQDADAEDDLDDAPDAPRLDNGGDDNAEYPPRPPDGRQTSLDLDDLSQTAADAWRFDDDTPHPESFNNDEDSQAAIPQRRADDLSDDSGTPASDETQTDFVLIEPGDWSELLDEVRDGGADPEHIPLEVEEELAAIHSELSAKEVRAPGDADTRPAADDIAADADISAGEMEVAEDGEGMESEPEVAEDGEVMASELETAEDGEIIESAAEIADENVEGEDKTEEDNAKAADAEADDPAKLFEDESAEIETIIMEGDSIRNAIEQELLQEDSSPPPERFDMTDTLFDTDMPESIRGGRRSTDPAGYGVIAGTVVLALLLAGQVIHAYRETLSTYGLFNRTIGPVYRLLGSPVTPEWNIQGWQFETTSGNVAEDDNVLTIFSRIGNKSKLPLPYPLVHVSLTDRWEEIIGSRVLTPDEYLAGDLDPSRSVMPGENFTAVITIDDPAIEATGFKLNVCYRASPGRVRCATEDFKN